MEKCKLCGQVLIEHEYEIMAMDKKTKNIIVCGYTAHTLMDAINNFKKDNPEHEPVACFPK